jgi:outer membrane immunogenic protein
MGRIGSGGKRPRGACRRLIDVSRAIHAPRRLDAHTHAFVAERSVGTKDGAKGPQPQTTTDQGIIQMRKFLTTTAIILSAAVATPAFAQDWEQPGEFDGFYVGGSIGATFNGGNDDETILFDRNLDGNFGDTVTTSGGANAFSPGFCGGTANTTAPGGGCNSEDEAIEFAGRIGFDRQFGNFVIGGVLEVGTSDYSSAVTAFSTTPATYTFNREVELLANLRARAGVTVTPTTLVYATGGVGYAQLDNSFSTTNTVNSVTRDLDDESIGFVVGAGVEQKLGPNFSIGIEYLYQQYEDESRVRLGNNGTTPATNPFLLGSPNGTDFIRSEDKFDMHSVRAVATFRF